MKNIAAEWIVELDFRANPEQDAASVRRDLLDELRGCRGVLKGRTARVGADEALRLKLRFADNIVSIQRAHA